MNKNLIDRFPIFKKIKLNYLLVLLFSGISIFNASALTTIWTNEDFDDDWNNSNNWDNGIPGVGDSAVITGEFETCNIRNGESFSVAQVVIGDDCTLRILPGGSLNVTDDAYIGDGDSKIFVIRGTISIAGNIDHQSMGGAFQVSGNSGTSATVALGGDFINDGSASFTVSNIYNDITFNGSSDQSIKASSNYGNLTFSGTGKKVISGIITISGTFTPGTSEVEYSGSSTQAIIDGDYGSLTFSGAGEKQISGDVTVSGTFTPGSPQVTYNGGDQSILDGGYGPLSITGTGTKTISGSTTTTSLLTTGSVIVEYDGAATQPIISGSYSGTLIFSGAGAKNITGNVTVGSAAQLNSSTVNITGSGFLSATGASVTSTAATINISGIGLTADSFTAGASDITISTESSSISANTFNVNTSTINYDRTGTITPLPAYYNVTFGSGGTTILGEALVVANDLTIDASSTMSMNDYSVNLSGDFINNGTLATDEGVFVFDGGTSQVISGSSTTEFHGLTIDGASTNLTLNSNVEINEEGVLTFNDGSTLTIGANTFTMKSTGASITSMIAEPTGSGTPTVSGDITFERYIPVSSATDGTGKKWWYLGFPGNDDITVSDFQDEVGVSGDFTGSNDFGGANGYSCKYYDETNNGTLFDDGWTDFPSSSNSETFTRGRGYTVYIRDTKTNTSPKTISVSGTSVLTDFTFPLTYTSGGGSLIDGWNLVANPFMSTIDWDNSSAWTKTNINNEYYAWDANSAAWKGWVGDDGGTSYNGGTQYIAPFQGFWVQRASASSTVFTVEQSAKVTTQTTLKRDEPEANVISILIDDLSGVNSNKSAVNIVLSDLMASSFYDSGVDAQYLPRNMFSGIFDAEVLLDAYLEATDGRALFTNRVSKNVDDEFNLKLVYSNKESYKISIDKNDFEEDVDAVVTLIDNYLSAEIVVGEDGLQYSFDVDVNNVNVSMEDRFAIRVARTSDVVGVVDQISAVSLSPNPCTGNSLLIKIEGTSNADYSVIDALGSVVSEGSLVSSGNSLIQEIQFDQTLESGVYFVKLRSDNSEGTYSFIVE